MFSLLRVWGLCFFKAHGLIISVGLGFRVYGSRERISPKPQPVQTEDPSTVSAGSLRIPKPYPF